MADVCQYGGQAKGDGTQGCSCFAAPDCSSTQKCPLGLGGKPKADGSQNCDCIIGVELILNSAYTTSKHSDPTSDGSSTITDYYTRFCSLRKKTIGSVSPNTAFGTTITSFCQYEAGEGGGDRISLCFAEELPYSVLNVKILKYSLNFKKSYSKTYFFNDIINLPSSGSIKITISPIN